MLGAYFVYMCQNSADSINSTIWEKPLEEKSHTKTVSSSIYYQTIFVNGPTAEASTNLGEHERAGLCAFLIITSLEYLLPNTCGFRLITTTIVRGCDPQSSSVVPNRSRSSSAGGSMCSLQALHDGCDCVLHQKNYQDWSKGKCRGQNSFLQVNVSVLRAKTFER